MSNMCLACFVSPFPIAYFANLLQNKHWDMNRLLSWGMQRTICRRWISGQESVSYFTKACWAFFWEFCAVNSRLQAFFTCWNLNYCKELRHSPTTCFYSDQMVKNCPVFLPFQIIVSTNILFSVPHSFGNFAFFNVICSWPTYYFIFVRMPNLCTFWQFFCTPRSLSNKVQILNLRLSWLPQYFSEDAVTCNFFVVSG